MNKYFEIYKDEVIYINNALSKIEKFYYQVSGINIFNKSYIQSAENAFTAELYHQLKCLQKKYSRDELVWHFDLNKMRANNIRPDLVLHKSPDNRDDQRIYIEIKTNPNVTDFQIRKDLRKILKAVTKDEINLYSNKLGYKCAFMIIGNIEFTKLKANCLKVFNKTKIKEREKILFFHFHSNDFTPKIYTLNNILNE